jgi:histidinol-phosphate aminotransferase
MTLSRRAFVRNLGLGGAGALSGALIAARGREAFTGLWPAGVEAALQAAGPQMIRLDSNENPNGPGAAALEAIRGAFGEASRYPDNPGEALTAALARDHGVTADHILLGCGSSEILRMAVFAFTSPTKALVAGAPTFEDPARHAMVIGSPVISVPVDQNLKLDLSGMASRAPGSGLVFLCNPNNPTATLHPANVVSDFIAGVTKASPGTMILVDEAYHHFVEDPSYSTAIPLALENPQVFVCRTFSKVFGMAGLRVGYAVGRPEALKPMRPHKLGSSVNVLGAAAALATLPDKAHVEHEKQANRAAREFTRRGLEALGYKVGISEANFIMVDVRRDPKDFQAACQELGVLVGRPFPPLTSQARISIGTMDEMQRAMEAFKKVLAVAKAASVSASFRRGAARV